MKEEKSLLLSTAYLAPVEYYMQMNKYSTVVIEKYDHYIKQTYRNRCRIATANGSQILTVPIEKPETLKCFTKDIRIAEHGNWQHLHWQAIVSAYKSTPYFEYYADDFFPFYRKKFDFLFEFNEQLRDLICSLIDIDVSISYSTDYYIVPGEKNIVDMRDTIHPKKETVSKEFKPYYQVFSEKNGFQLNLSIIDLLFNMGPEAVLFL